MKKIKSFSLALSLLICFVTMAQQRTITGIVSDKKEALPFVTIQIKGTQNGTQTDLDGTFSIKINKNDILIFRYIGYENYELEIGEKVSKYYIQLKSNAYTLEETYGDPIRPVKRNELQLPTKITPDELNKIIAIEDTKSVKGKMPGINIPIENSKPSIRRTGYSNTTNYSDPLYVIDGVISKKEKFAKIKPDDITSIKVLKGNDATAIYGKYGVNGVILITTKKLSKKELKKLKKQIPIKDTDSL